MHYRNAVLVHTPKVKLATMKVPRVHMAHVVIRTGHSEDDEYDSHATRTHEHGAAMADVHERMENPPHTWKEYESKPGGMMSIVEMEYRELMACKSEGSMGGIEKELTDLAAACICALKKMKSK